MKSRKSEAGSRWLSEAEATSNETKNPKTQVLCSFFLAAGNNMLFSINR